MVVLYGRWEIKRLFWVINKTATGTVPTGLHNHAYTFTFGYYLRALIFFDVGTYYKDDFFIILLQI